MVRRREDAFIYTLVSRYRLPSGLPSLHPEIVTRSRWRKHASACMTSVCDSLIIKYRKTLKGGTRAVSKLELATLRCARCNVVDELEGSVTPVSCWVAGTRLDRASGGQHDRGASESGSCFSVPQLLTTPSTTCSCEVCDDSKYLYPAVFYATLALRLALESRELSGLAPHRLSSCVTESQSVTPQQSRSDPTETAYYKVVGNLRAP